jgi:hypothetical protein
MCHQLVLLALGVLHNVRKVVLRSDHSNNADHEARERDQQANVRDERAFE